MTKKEKVKKHNEKLAKLQAELKEHFNRNCSIGYSKTDGAGHIFVQDITQNTVNALSPLLADFDYTFEEGGLSVNMKY